MTIAKINIRQFTKMVKEAREFWDDNAETYDNDYRAFLRDEEVGCRAFLWNVSDEWKSRAAVAPAAFDEIVENLSIAAARRQQFGATQAQIEQIARLAVKAGMPLSQISADALTHAEASNIIETF